ncbi:MAG: response regulator [bacterium]|nr:response regulator [bacterium]
MKANILVVDDTHENLRMLNKILTEQDYVVRPVSSGAKAFSSIRVKIPDLVLLDIMMPDMDGYEVCRRLKADESTCNIPVVFISALTEVDDMLKGFSVGGADYITKPFQVREVLVRVETQLAVREAQQRLLHQNNRLQQEINEHKRTENVLQQFNRELSLMNRVGQMFSSSLDLDAVLKNTLQEIQRLLDVISTSVWLRFPESGELECREIIGPGSKNLAHVRLPAGEGITGWVAQHGESVVSADILKDPRHHDVAGQQSDFTMRSMLSVPLKVKGEVTGVLNLVDPEVDRFTQEDLRFVEPIAATAAIAIENARLYTTAQQEIAERKRAEAKLEEANASKDKFFSIISHDLRSPFNSLLGFTEFMYQNFDTYTQEQVKNNIQRLYKISECLFVLLENLLTWARLQRGGMEYSPKRFDFSDIVENIMSLFHAESERKGISLSSSIQTGMELYADYDMIHTILRNLVSNALKFTGSGGTIHIANQTFEEFFEIMVSDSGSGIPRDDLQKLFRIDMQYRRSGTDGESGTGLGLILCQELVHKNGGKIWVESEFGTGTIFRFTLPRRSDGVMEWRKKH